MMSAHSGRVRRRTGPVERRARDLRSRGAHRNDEGVTLVELMIASSLLIMLLTIVLVTLTVFINLSGSVTAQYQEFDQLIPATTALQQLIRAEVEPAPATGTGAPTPAFASVGNFSLTFYSNVGDEYGPAKIVAAEVTPSGGVPTTCSLTAICDFQVQEFLPLTAGTPARSQCPVTTYGVGTACTYGAANKLVTNVIGVTNNPNSVNGPIMPIFNYTVFDAPNNFNVSLTAAQVQNNPITTISFAGDAGWNGLNPPNIATCGPPVLPVSPATTGTPAAVACPADAIQSIGIHLIVNRKGADTNSASATGDNGAEETQLIIYRAQGNSQSPTLPFQYTQAVG